MLPASQCMSPQRCPPQCSLSLLLQVNSSYRSSCHSAAPCSPTSQRCPTLPLLSCYRSTPPTAAPACWSLAHLLQWHWCRCVALPVPASCLQARPSLPSTSVCGSLSPRRCTRAQLLPASQLTCCCCPFPHLPHPTLTGRVVRAWWLTWATAWRCWAGWRAAPLLRSSMREILVRVGWVGRLGWRCRLLLQIGCVCMCDAAPSLPSCQLASGSARLPARLAGVTSSLLPSIPTCLCLPACFSHISSTASVCAPLWL